MTVVEEPHIKAVTDAKERNKARLHGFVMEVVEGQPAISVLYSETPKLTNREVVFVGDGAFDALRIVKLANKSMNASNLVVGMLVEMYASQRKLSMDQVKHLTY